MSWPLPVSANPIFTGDNPSEKCVPYSAHDSSITVVYPSGPEQAPQAVYTVQLPVLPAISLIFTSETALVAAGHDCQPVLYEGSLEAGWALSRSLDDHEKRAGAGSIGGGRIGASGVGRLNNSEAFNRFRAADSRGVAQGSAPAAAVAGQRLTATGTELLTLHQNTITSVRAYVGGETSGQDVSQVTTSGVDGRLVLWDVGGVAGVTRGIGRVAM